MTRAILLLAAVLLVSWPVEKGRCGMNETRNLFGLTNLWTVHLTFETSRWADLEPAASGPSRPGVPGNPMMTPPDGPRPGPPRQPEGRNAGPFPGPGPFAGEFPWSTCTFQCGEETLTNVAIRFKGHSSFAMSRGTFKRPFRINFSRGEKGRRFLGVEEVSFNNNFNDSTQFREALAYEVCRDAGLPAPRTAFARVYLTISGERTNEMLGLYTLAEPVDRDFLKSRFGTKEGLLLKPERLPSLEYLGEDWNSYTNRYQPKTDATAADIERFIELTRLIARADDATLVRELPARMDLSNFLRYLAVNALLANYDSFMGNGHNYYLFQPAHEGKAAFIPWDLNEAFGGHPPLGPRLRQAELSVLQPQAGQNRLIERVLGTPTWAAEYQRELAHLLTNACAPDRLQAKAIRLAALTRETVFAESPLARAVFQRTALSQTDIVIPAGGFNRAGMPPRVDRQEPPLADWIPIRMRNAADELAGKRTGTRPAMRGFGSGRRMGPP